MTDRRQFSHAIVGPTRRRFVQGLAAAGAASAFLGTPVSAQVLEQGQNVLSGTRFDLTIAQMPVNFTGRARMGMAVNGAIPAPILRWREGDTVSINVTNRMSVSTSVHWHGILLPNPMDGVPGLTYRGIAPGETFTYRFPIIQSGTYWYHSHTGVQLQSGLYGPLVIEPREKDPFAFDREYVVLLSDWTDEDPETILSNLKMQSDYYNYHQRTLGTFFDDANRMGFGAALENRMMWGGMRMSPTDISDVTGSTYTFLVNGHPPAANWTALFKPKEKVRLRFVNGSAMTTYDVRIPGLKLIIVAADGSNVEPVAVDQFRIAVAEAYDVIVAPEDAAYTIFAEAEDRSGYARATLAPRPGMSAEIPPLDPRPMRTMADMGMMAMGAQKSGAMPNMGAMVPDHGAMAMPATDRPAAPTLARPVSMAMMMGTAKNNADGVDPMTLGGQPDVNNVAMRPMNRLAQPGAGLDEMKRRVLVYTDLKALHPDPQTRPPNRDVVFHLTGNMERFVWGFDGKTFAQSEPVRVKLGERVRFVLINDTMMEHPIHLHGYLFSLENGNTGKLPWKHTVNVKPAERVSFVFTAHTAGHWAFHCHLLYHMEAGMFRTVLVA
jgi:CopA family copper-resistance protein